MHSIPLALTWEFWRRVRVWFPVTIAIGATLPAVIFSVLSTHGALDSETVVSLILAFVLVNSILFVTLLHLHPGPPTRFYAWPISPPALVASQMFPPMALTALAHLAVAVLVNALFDVHV